MTRIEKEINATYKAAARAQKAKDKQALNALQGKIDRLIQTAREIFHAKPHQPAHFIQQRRTA